jgi:CubicO group peptidase (beta-lactamase class C family)
MAVPYERWYGVLAKTNVQLPFNQRRRVGGGGLYSTVGDLCHFLLAHMNLGKFEGYQLLQPDTVSLMHSRATSTSGDFMQVAYGYGWGIYQNESRQMWDITFNPRGYQGHGGRYWGYNGVMYMVDEVDGAYGFILLMNHSMVETMDEPWAMSVHMNIQDLVLDEAYQMYQASLNQ